MKRTLFALAMTMAAVVPAKGVGSQALVANKDVWYRARACPRVLLKNLACWSVLHGAFHRAP